MKSLLSRIEPPKVGDKYESINTNAIYSFITEDETWVALKLIRLSRHYDCESTNGIEIKVILSNFQKNFKRL